MKEVLWQNSRGSVLNRSSLRCQLYIAEDRFLNTFLSLRSLILNPGTMMIYLTHEYVMLFGKEILQMRLSILID